MTLSKADQQHLQHAQGYLELSMFIDANNALEKITHQARVAPEVLEVRLNLFMEAKKWDLAIEVARYLTTIQPSNGHWFISTAFCLQKLKRTEDAKAILLSGPDSLKEKAVFHYNLGCYEAQLGNLEAANVYVKRAIEMDKTFQKEAIDDPDLEPLWASFKTQ